jgi:hypothetical protein
MGDRCSFVLFACHLFVGILAGLVLTERYGERRLVPFLVLGAVLPDLLDKPLGHLLLGGSLDNGRILFHGLMVVGILFLAAALYRRHRAPLLCLGAMILVHQLMDGMWELPETWFFPAFGMWPPGHAPDYFLDGLSLELTSPTEWLFGALGVVMLVRIFRRIPPIEKRTVAVPSALLLVLGAYSMLMASGPWGSADLVLGTVAVCSAAMLWRLPVERERYLISAIIGHIIKCGRYKER